MNPLIFWSGKEGDKYTERNREFSIANNIAFFAEATKRMGRIDYCIEYGCNIGLNLAALDALYTDVMLYGVDVNKNALELCSELVPRARLYSDNILNFESETADLTFTKGVLIHIPPADLKKAYKTLYETSTRYILIAEYYNPTPVMIPYHGHDDLLWKRDFAGEMMDIYKDLKLIDYGFKYRRDKHNQDDITYFLMEKGCL